MVRSLKYRWLLLLLLLVVFPLGAAHAQEVFPITYGTSIVNRVNNTGDMVDYTFNGNVGDLVTIRAVGISAGADPTLALIGPSQQVLATNDNVLSIPVSTSAQIVYRLVESGPHYIVVSGAAGDFVLTLDSRPATLLVGLQLDTPVTLTLPIAQPETAFVFNTDPIYATSLLINATPVGLDAYLEIRDATGQIITTLRNNLDNACISVGQGDQLLELTVSALPEVIGTITFTLSNAACILGDTPVERPPMPTPVFTPVVVEGVCTASSPRNVNVRSGPGTNYVRLALLQAGQPIQVTGQSQDGQWLVVQNDVLQGWMSASVVSVTGPCAQLPVVQAPPLPVASPTPGFPVIVVVTPIVVTPTPPVMVITATGVVPPQPTGTLPPPPASFTPPPPTVVPVTLTPTVTPTATITVTPG